MVILPPPVLKCAPPPALHLQSLLELVATEVSGSEAARENEGLQGFHRATLAHIAAQKQKGGEVAAKYALLQL